MDPANEIRAELWQPTEQKPTSGEHLLEKSVRATAKMEIGARTGSSLACKQFSADWHRKLKENLARILAVPGALSGKWTADLFWMDSNGKLSPRVEIRWEQPLGCRAESEEIMGARKTQRTKIMKTRTQIESQNRNHKGEAQHTWDAKIGFSTKDQQDYNRFKVVLTLPPSFNYLNENWFVTHYSKSMNENSNRRSGKEHHPFRVLFIASSKR
jgi:hypothetical protein